jgi:hypothetical protein
MSAAYYRRTEVADAKLCATAKLLQRLVSQQRIDIRLAQRALRSIVYAKKTGPRSGPYRSLEQALGAEDLRLVEEAVNQYETEMTTEGEIGLPSDSEWVAFLASPLDGRISISFALQWRYQFPPQ